MDSPAAKSSGKRKRKAAKPFTPPGNDVPQLAATKVAKKTDKSIKIKKVPCELLVFSLLPQANTTSSLGVIPSLPPRQVIQPHSAL